MKLHTINTGFFKLDGGAMHGVIPKSMWHKVHPSDENNMCSWAMRCMLIEDEDRLILIDTGMGNKQSEKFFSYYTPFGNDNLLKSIEEKGYKADDITDVFLTHLHFDHCGGAVSKEEEQLFPTFKNATYWTNEKHWDIALQPNEREKASFLKENLLPLQEAGQLKFIANESDIQFSKNIELIFVNGHTEAMMLPLINYNGKKILFCADLIPAMAHISLPWVMAYDMQPLITLNEKRKIIQQAFDENWILFFEHDYEIECCSLQQTERGIRSKENFKLESI
ncbi:MAG: MBL fold metallo-hydrolase [Chitinophagaceae bacterium]|nr:MBL fold metallo-hydrolase [Chitinophagaceae bacterium]